MTQPNITTKNVIVPANGSLPVSATGRIVKCLTTTGANGAIRIQFGDGGSARFNVLDKYTLPDVQRFNTFTLRNTTGAAVTLEIFVGDGDIETGGDVTVSGTVEVETAAATELQVKTKAGTVLETNDADTQTAIADVETAVAAFQTALLALLQNDETKRSALTTLAGATASVVTATGATNIVTAGTNANGVIIRHASVSSGGNATSVINVAIGGNVLIEATGNSGAVSTVKDVFVPAGVAVTCNITTSGKVAVWYEVL